MTDLDYLVWSGIAENLSSIISVWWEDPEIVKKLNAFRRALFVPLVDRLGFEYKEGESSDVTALRFCSITKAALAGYEGVVRELKNWFAHYIKTGDSNIPADLLKITYRTAVAYGGKEEYETMQRIYNKPQNSNSTTRIYPWDGSHRGSGAAQTDRQTSNRDVYWRDFFEEQFDALYKRFENNFMLSHLVSVGAGVHVIRMKLRIWDSWHLVAFPHRRTMKTL
ncbi:hypothetical protein AX15_004694 [Amanita polypyramis BW_CC]|nr:hypothetical protein AX15_004694 [Amanita polypyramis BW_CC]